jgi:integrase
MISLPNNCRRSNLSVHPSDWKTTKASIAITWYISYRFYDPGTIKPKRIIIKGMNIFKELAKRQAATKLLLTEELARLQDGFNPISGRCKDESGILDHGTLIIPALRQARDMIQCGRHTRDAIRKSLVHIEKSIFQLNFDMIPISQIKRKHIRFILDQVGKAKGGWTAPSFNHYRSYLIMLFNELEELEITEISITKIKKKPVVATIRETLTIDQRGKINAHLKAKSYAFWRFSHIFFHSGTRISEIMRVRLQDVDLPGQRYKIIVLKGRNKKEVWKTIKDIAVPLWSEICASAAAGDYIFSKDLVPGPTLISERQITKRWRIHVKKFLGIDADFYSLKHLNTTETVDQLSDQDAAKLNSHSSTAMVRSIYDVKRDSRQHERLKKVSNPFA